MNDDEFIEILKWAKEKVCTDNRISSEEINRGFCEDFANLVMSRVLEAYDFDSGHDNDNEPYHVIVVWKGKYYDSDCFEGVDYYWQLPIFNRRMTCQVETKKED